MKATILNYRDGIVHVINIIKTDDVDEQISNWADSEQLHTKEFDWMVTDTLQLQVN